MSERERADTRMEQIVSALKDKDREALKALFSKKALEEADDFDSGVDSLFQIIQGDCTIVDLVLFVGQTRDFYLAFLRISCCPFQGYLIVS